MWFRVKLCQPDTPIATPNGDRPIATLQAGDLVYSVDHQQIVAVPIRRVERTPVVDHHVESVTLASGAVLEISALHPLDDGRSFGDLRPGSAIGDVRVLDVETIPYVYPFTHDILPDSDTGSYYAGGALIGSTLGP